MKNIKEKELKSTNGITLIALVITIIVLLILAGISISMLSGNNGILQRATDAKTETERGEVYEQISLATASGEMEYYSNGTDRLTAYKNALLNGVDGIDRDNLTDTGSNLITGTVTTKSGKQYDFSVPVPVTDITLAEHDGTEYPLASTVLKVNLDGATPEEKSPYILYKNELYRVLYDTDSGYQRVEIVSVNSLKKIRLGYNDPTLPDSLSTADNFEKAKWSYNNAITTLNNEAQEYIDPNIVDRARCIGSDPNNPYKPDNEETPEMFSSGIYSWCNGYFLAEDTHYTEDSTQLNNIEAGTVSNTTYGESYWLASRYTSDNYSTLMICIRYKSNNSGNNFITICNSNERSQRLSQDREYGFRPVLQLKSNTKIINGNGTKESPYILGE